MSKKSVLFAGLAIVATLGLLFAPNKGEDTRKDLDKEKVLSIAKKKGKEIEKKANELYDLAVEKGTPVLEKAASDVRKKTIEVLNDTVAKLEKAENKAK